VIEGLARRVLLAASTSNFGLALLAYLRRTSEDL
jgi:hypothetical protein